MGRRSRQALLVALIALAGVFASSAGATSGTETFNVLLVISGAAGGRDVVASPVVARGAFNGVGRLVEIPNQPGDPDSAARDDLVFAGGTMHLISVTSGFTGSLDPRTCIFEATIVQTTTIVGGSGRFGDATGVFAATLHGHALAARNADGSCSQERAPLVEIDALTLTGTLSF
jgi:hypothetical protein